MCNTQLKRKLARNYTKSENKDETTTNQQKVKNFQENEVHNCNLNKRTQLEKKIGTKKKLINEQSKTTTNQQQATKKFKKMNYTIAT